MLFKKRILIIDSAESTRRTLVKELLAILPDIDIIACATGKEALTAVKRFEFGVITINLPLDDTEGHALVDQIRKQAKNRDTPLFVVSGEAQPEMELAQHANEDTTAVTAYLQKVEDQNELVNFISDFMEKEDTLMAKIMYVDQSATSARITTSILARNNFRFTLFKDGESAIAELKHDFATNGHCSYDILMTDLSLSYQFSGLDLIRTVRNELKFDFKTLPVLLMTVEPCDDEKTDFTGIFGAGTNDFITKPVKEQALLERLYNLINIRRQNEALTPS